MSFMIFRQCPPDGPHKSLMATFPEISLPPAEANGLQMPPAAQSLFHWVVKHRESAPSWCWRHDVVRGSYSYMWNLAQNLTLIGISELQQTQVCGDVKWLLICNHWKPKSLMLTVFVPRRRAVDCPRHAKASGIGLVFVIFKKKFL